MGIQVERRDVYLTGDGREFTSKPAAEAHEMLCGIRALVCEDLSLNRGGETDPGQFAQELFESRAKLVEILWPDFLAKQETQRDE